LIGTHKFRVHADGVSLLDETINVIVTEAMLDASKGIGLEINAEKTVSVRVFMSHRQAAGRKHNINVAN
jgi:hypothetical protein